MNDVASKHLPALTVGAAEAAPSVVAVLAAVTLAATAAATAVARPTARRRVAAFATNSALK